MRPAGIAALAVLALSSAALVPASAAQERDVSGLPEAADLFAQRQADLVALAGSLGRLHRLRQLCAPEDGPDLFRQRLMTIIPLEVPSGGTRLDMIARFNAGYRSAAAEHAICGAEARGAYAAEAERALGITERLYAPFR